MTQTDTTTVGFIGTGAMGGAMALRLLSSGHDILVHNRTRTNAQSCLDAGAQWAASPRELVERCDIVIGCLRDTTAVESIYLGLDGMLTSAREGHVFVEHATFAPASARAVAAAAATAGSSFLDVPVTGGPEGARRGTLTGMVGGDGTALDVVRPVLGQYLASMQHVGGSGRGLELKLVNQLLVTIHMAAAAEAATMLEALRLARRPAAEVLVGGWAQSAMLTRTLDLLDQDVLDGTGATIGGMREVQALVETLAVDAGVGVTVFESARTLFEAAAARGLDRVDPAGLMRIARSHPVQEGDK